MEMCRKARLASYHLVWWRLERRSIREMKGDDPEKMIRKNNVVMTLEIMLGRWPSRSSLKAVAGLAGASPFGEVGPALG